MAKKMSKTELKMVWYLINLPATLLNDKPVYLL